MLIRHRLCTSYTLDRHFRTGVLATINRFSERVLLEISIAQTIIIPINIFQFFLIYRVLKFNKFFIFFN